MTARFAAEGFWKAFGRFEVLRGASVWGEAGLATVLLGRNGSGKSTLFRCALGFLRADAGVVVFDGARSVRPRLPALAADGLFFLPDRDLCARGFTLRQHFAAVAHRFRAADVAGAVARWELAGLMDRRPSAMSGGERRRAEIALIEARRPRVLIADEPFRGIAPADAERVADRLRALARSGCAVIVSGHETGVLLSLADRIVWMTAGTTHALGTVEAARAHAQFRREYLGPRD